MVTVFSAVPRPWLVPGQQARPDGGGINGLSLMICLPMQVETNKDKQLQRRVQSLQRFLMTRLKAELAQRAPAQSSDQSRSNVESAAQPATGSSLLCMFWRPTLPDTVQSGCLGNDKCHDSLLW